MTLIRLLFAIQLAFLLVSAQFDVSKCGSEKRCEKEPQGCNDESDCTMIFSSKPLGDDQIEFEAWIPNKLSNGQKVNYLAVGFSDDTKMGADGVTYCYSLDDGSKGIGIGKNTGKSFSHATNEGNAKLEELSVEDEKFYCKFTQNVNKGSEDLLKPDLSKNYHILVVRGTAAKESQLSIHAFGGNDNPFASNDKVELTAALAPPEKPTESNDAGEENVNLAAKPETKKTSAESPETTSKSSEATGWKISFDTRQTLQRLHGSLMLIAWFGLVLSAIFSARYLRDHWPNTTISGLNIWFHIHRLLNVLGVILIVISVILIFIGTNFQWTGPTASGTRDENLTSGTIHSLVGVISVILAIAQPFMAMLRCDKMSSKRPIFNVFHRSFGLLGILLAVIAIGIAVIDQINGYFSSNHTLSTGLLIAFFVFIILVIIGQEYIKLHEAHERQKVTAIEMQTRSSPAPSSSYYYKNQVVYSSPYRHVTLFLFVIFGSVSFAVSILLTYLVWAH